MRRRGPAGEITIEQADPRLWCPSCGGRAWVKDRPVVSYVDLPFGGVPITLRWRSTGSSAPTPCAHSDPSPSATTGSPRSGAGSAPGRPSGWPSRSPAVRRVAHLARELDCGWDAINVAVRIYGAAWLAADTKRLKETTAIGLDESLFVRAGPYKHKVWSTTVCDVANHALIDVLPTRDFTAVARWLRAQPHHVREPRLRVLGHVEDLRRRVQGGHPQGDAGHRPFSVSICVRISCKSGVRSGRSPPPLGAPTAALWR